MPNMFGWSPASESNLNPCRHCGAPHGHYARCPLLNRASAETRSLIGMLTTDHEKRLHDSIPTGLSFEALTDNDYDKQIAAIFKIKLSER